MLVGWLASLDAVESVGLVGEWCLAGARAMCGCCERAKRCGASQHVERRTPGEAAERAEPQPLEPWCVGTAQLTSEACAASKPVPEGNVSHQQLVSAAPGSC